MTPSELPIDEVTGRPVWHGLPVPWIARWTAEAPVDTPLRAALIGGQLHVGVGPDPALHPLGVAAGFRVQRDELGLLWQPDHEAPGSGTPEFATVHARRQRACMMDRLCQVCGGPFGDQPATFLDAANRDPRQKGRPFITATAPTCRSCAAVAMRKCPANRNAERDRVIVVALSYRPWGALGDVFDVDPETESPQLTQPRRTLQLGDARLSRTCVKQLYVEITRYTEEPVPTRT